MVDAHGYVLSFFQLGRVDPDGAFKLCVQVSPFTAKLDNANSVDVQRKYDEWVVDYRYYNLQNLEKDLTIRAKWGSNQHPVISEFDMSKGGERKIVDDKDLSVAFSERLIDKKMFLYVDVKEKPVELVATSVVSEATETLSNVVNDNNSALVQSSFEPAVEHGIDWDNLEIIPLTEDKIGSAVPLMSEDAMYEFLGLRAEDERAKKASFDAENENETNAGPMDLEGAELPVDDCIPGEDSIFYDKENPPMKVGTIYASMNEFRSAVRQHAIMGQFDLGTEKSCTTLFRGYCKAEGCPWAIVARLMSDKKHVRVYFANFL